MAFEVVSKNNLMGSENMNTTTFDPFPDKGPTKLSVALCVIFIVGILGNFVALVKLARKRKFNNRSYILMLRCLTTNNLIGLVGIVTTIIVKRSFHELSNSKWFCASFVIWRFFGISSGCISAIMSFDRYMILNHPLFHQKYFTYKFIRNAIIGLGFIAAIITFFPIIGFGIYYDKGTKTCLRYRDTKTLADRAYAILFFVFGSLICLTIVTCNTFVVKAILCYKRRRFSDSSNPTSQSSLTKSQGFDIKFAKLIAFLSLTFVICWMPQMISIILALKSHSLPEGHWFFKLSDQLIALLFALDPYIYVLSGRNLMQCFGLRPKKSLSSQDQCNANNKTSDSNL